MTQLQNKAQVKKLKLAKHRTNDKEHDEKLTDNQ